MRLTVLLFLIIASPAFAQNAAQNRAPVVAPASAVAATEKFDWRSLGQPIDDDTKAMRDRNVYFNTDKINGNISLDKAVLSQAKISEWISTNLGQVMTLDGKNYDKQIYNNRLLFTPTGYADYIVYLKNINLAPFLKNNQFKVVAFVDGAPNITSEGLDQTLTPNPYSWQITTVLVLSYLDYRNEPPAALFKDKDRSKIDNRLPMQAKIELVRIPAQGNNNLVAINHLKFDILPPPSKTESLDPAPADE